MVPLNIILFFLPPPPTKRQEPPVSMAEVTMKDVVVVIEDVLGGNNRDDSPIGNGIGKLLHSVNQFIEEKKEHDLACPAEDKVFVEFAKSSANVYATLFNAVNTFGTTTSYVLHNSDSKNLANNEHMKTVFIAMTMAFIPISVVTVGLAHALEHNKKMINLVARMLCIEVGYMTVMGSLFAYYLLDGSVIIHVAVSILGLLMIAITLGVLWKRPLQWCLDRGDVLCCLGCDVEANGSPSSGASN